MTKTPAEMHSDDGKVFSLPSCHQGTNREMVVTVEFGEKASSAFQLEWRRNVAETAVMLLEKSLKERQQ